MPEDELVAHPPVVIGSPPNPDAEKSRRERWVWLAARLREHSIRMGGRFRWPADLVEDACQDVTIKLLDHLDLGATADENQARLHAWLRTTFRNRMIDLLRRRTRDSGITGPNAEIEEAVTSFTSQVGRRLDKDLLLDQLDLILAAGGHETTRRILDLARREKLGNGEIAARLGLDSGTVRRHLARIKELTRADPTLRRLSARTDGD